MPEMEKPTDYVGAPVADNQDARPTGPGFCAQRPLRRSSNELSSFPLLPKSIDKSAKPIKQMGTVAQYSSQHGA